MSAHRPDMQSKGAIILRVDHDISKTHSRSYVSENIPYSDAHFTILKYRLRASACSRMLLPLAGSVPVGTK
jgi:hypothetical protein